MATERRYMLIGQGARKDKDQTISGDWTFKGGFGDFVVERDAVGGSGLAYSNANGLRGYAGFTDAKSFRVWDDSVSEMLTVDVNGNLSVPGAISCDGILYMDHDVGRFKGERVASALADDGTVTFDIVGGLDEGVCIIVTNGSYYDGCVIAHNGISTNLIAGNTNYVSTGNGSNPDVDGDINIWKPTSTTMSIKNRRGASRAITVYQFGL